MKTTYAVSYFKAHALSILDELSQTDQDEIIVTKRGKPIARILPVVEDQRHTNTPGRMKHTLIYEGDIVSPLGEDDWDFSL